MRKQSFFFCYLTLPAAVLLSVATVYAKEPAMGRLIQSTTFREDYQALVYLGLTDTPLLQKEDAEAACRNVICSSVRIQGNGSYGSGSIYEMTQDEVIIATNRHVLQDFDEESYVTFRSGRSVSGRMIGCGEKADVGFISVPAGSIPYEELLDLKSVRKRKEVCNGLKTGDGFFVIDTASDLNSPVLYEGKILDKRKYLADYGMEMLYGDCRAVPGMSGSGIFDLCGNYIGMLSGGTVQNEIAAVPLDVMEEEYRKIAGR